MKHPYAFVALLVSFARGLHIPDLSTILHLSVRDPTFTYEPITTGYIAFGDSYAAGIGAGSTSGDGCRKGANSYPHQLHTWVDSLQPGVNFQDYSCSGAKAPELLQGSGKGQIDKWNNPSKANRATLSIGGNDIGFYDVLTSCVLRVGQFFAGNCDEFVDKAYSLMNGEDFKNNISTALKQIISKSGRSGFKIVQTGYPTFFNDQTASCDYTTFYFYQPGHHGFHRGDGWAYLYQDLRSKLNKLVADLNAKLKSIGDEVNQDFSQPRVLFADPNPAFEGHRFCEKGITEPDSSNKNNWLFLSSWPDVLPPGISSSPEQHKPLSEQHIPDAATCASSQDWSDLMLCDMEKAGIASNTANGVVLAPKIELPGGSNVSTSDIGWLYPTAYVKTFHPRSVGYRGIRELVRATW